MVKITTFERAKPAADMQDMRLEWLKPKMDRLFELKAKHELRGRDFNTSIQGGHEYRNPRICEKLIENFAIKQYGSNFAKDQFNPDSWSQKPEAFYDSRHYRLLAGRRSEQQKRQH